MVNFAAVALLTCALGVVASTDVHPMNAHDLVQFHKVSAPIPSASGQHALFTSSQYNIEKDVTTHSLWLLQLSQTPENEDAEDSIVLLSNTVTRDPVWLSPSVVAGLAPVDGVSQLWTADVASLLRNTSTVAVPEFHQLTSLPIDMFNLKCHATTSQCAFTAEVFDEDGGSLEGARKRKEAEAARKDTAMVFDELFVRHWDEYVIPGQRNNLFVMSYLIDDGNVKLSGKPVNVMSGHALETPVPKGGPASYDFSPDGKEIAFSSRVPKRTAAWNTRLDIYTVPTDASRDPRSVSRGKGAASHPVYSPDGLFLAWLEMEIPQHEADKNRVIVQNRETGKSKDITKHWDRSVSALAWTEDSKSLIATAEDKGHVRLFAVSVVPSNAWSEKLSRKHKPRRLVKKHSSTGVSVAGSTLFFSQSSGTHPAEIHTLDLKTALAVSTDDDDDDMGDEILPKKRTDMNGALLLRTLRSTPEEFWFRGAGKEPVMGWLYKPVGFSAHAGKYPVAFLIHGGPEGAWNDGWSDRWNPQIFAGAGYVVVVVNFHGSTGYGTKFTEAILKHWGDRPYKDLMNGLDHVISHYPFIDPSRIHGLGASYGGYMVNWLNSHTHRFRSLVTHDGIFDTRSAYFTTDELWFPESEFGGKPYDRSGPAPALYEKFNPARNVRRWSTPTLVIHGGLDFRLPITEGLAAFTALQRQGIPSKLMLFLDENHWVLKPANSLRWHKEVLDWVADWDEKPIWRDGVTRSDWMHIEEDDDKAEARVVEDVDQNWLTSDDSLLVQEADSNLSASA
ncbi:hypothetical protein HKX48_004598 [Thoreauomyces humboldtii]|nr:hypothetical protein HKX48_004598 [Thoreauomyces humboldtii]